MLDISDIIITTASLLIGTSVSMNEPLMEAGLDSLGATELASRLGAGFSMDFPSTLLFDHPSAASIRAVLEKAVTPTALVPRDATERPKVKVACTFSTVLPCPSAIGAAICLT